MSAFANVGLPPFAAEVLDGLSSREKYLNPRYLYDEIGSSLFEVIQRLPEYGISRAQERINRRYSADLARRTQPASVISLDHCADHAHASSEWLALALKAMTSRNRSQPVMLTLLNNAVNLDPASFTQFLERLRTLMKPGDYLLFAADLVKEIDKSVAAYDDPSGIAAAFNRNLLARINRELAGRFDLRTFQHKVRYNAFLRRVELHLLSNQNQEVYVGALGRRFTFRAGETIHTESFYKFSELELETLALSTGFQAVKTWIDIEWAYAQALWTV